MLSSNSENIFLTVKQILNDRQLSISQVVSVTMDNCSVMRGVKKGVEARIREENPNLLDVSGDTVHMVNNAAKAFFEPIEDFCSVQSLAGQIFYDIDSPKCKAIFQELQNLLFGKCLSSDLFLIDFCRCFKCVIGWINCGMLYSSISLVIFQLKSRKSGRKLF